MYYCETSNIKAIDAIHMNHVVRVVTQKIFGDTDRIRIIKPLEVLDFNNFLSRFYLTLMDSCGIKEEALSLSKHILAMINTTERPEGIAVGTLKLVGTR